MTLALLLTAVTGAWADWTGGTYTATADENLGNIIVSDDVTLTINAGVTVTVTSYNVSAPGIKVANGKTLTIVGPGTLVVNGAKGIKGSDSSMMTGNPGGQGTDGGAAITGNIIVKEGATVEANGGYGGQGGTGGSGTSGSNPGQGGKGGKGGKGAAAFTGAVTIFSGTITAKGGSGGDGGSGGYGGFNPENANHGLDGEIGEGGANGNAFAGTLTFYGGTVNVVPGSMPGYGKPSGNVSNAFVNPVTMKATTYELKGSNSSNYTAIELADIVNYRYVSIVAADYVEPTFDYELTDVATDHGSGQVKFFIGGKEVEGAYETDEGKTVTVKVTPDEGWVVDAFAVTAEVYRYWEGSRRAQAMVPMQRTVDLKYERTTLDGVAIYTFTMPASNVRVTGAYMKLSTLYFDPADRTNLMKVNVGSYGDVNLEDGKTVKIDKVEDILEGAEITLTANTGYKFRKVEVKKKGASTPLDNTTTAWTAGTYAVPAGGLTYSAAITVSGDVTLVLTDGETLTLNKGISLASGATLTVEGNGTMNVNGTNGNTSSTVAGSGMMCFKSGTLVATGGNGHVGNDLGQYGMNGGISHGGSAINGSLTLEGGNVTATGGNGGNAGGGGINWATGGNGGSAITGNVIINGGNWTANNGSNGTLLSGGNNNKAGTGGKAVAGTVTDNR